MLSKNLTIEETTEAGCGCRTGCDTRRCACRKAGRACGDGCQCESCANPLNGLVGMTLSDCARDNAQQVAALTDDELHAMKKFPCGHTIAPLVDLLGNFECSECNEAYWYSFCSGHVEQDNCTWHCEACHGCVDWRVWHCDNCNRCTYGVSFPCDGCGAEGPMADII